MKTFVSLFAGVGGFDLGFEKAGFKCVGQCEIDKKAASVLERHWPNVPRHDDVSTLRHDTFEHPDIVTFGSPCQDLSVAGRRDGMDGNRSSLFFKASNYIKKIQEATNGQYPKVAVWENVPGSLTSNGGEDFRAVLHSMVGGRVQKPRRWGNAGVVFGPKGSAEWRVLDSQHFGVAQRRRRIFLVVHFGGRRAGQVLFEPEGFIGGSGEVPTSREDPSDDFARSSGESIKGLKQADCFGFNWQNWSKDGWAITGDGVGPLDVSQVKAVVYIKNRKAKHSDDYETWIESEIMPTINGFDRGVSRETTVVVQSPTVRRLMPIECERLQGFPDGWTSQDAKGKALADTPRYKMMGNAVTVNVAHWIASRLSL